MYKTFIFSVVALCINSSVLLAQNPFSDWVKANFSTTYTHLENLVKQQNPGLTAEDWAYFIEIQCNSFANVLKLMDKEDADWSHFEKALVKGCSYKGSDRGTLNWWEWPETDWTKVEFEYQHHKNSP